MQIPLTSKKCPSCNQEFLGHPASLYCSSTCYQREKQRRRSRRRYYKPHNNPTDTLDPRFQASYTTPSAEELEQICQDIITHVYEKDIQLIGTLPPIAPPHNVVINKVPGTNYSIAYHATRGDYSKLLP